MAEYKIEGSEELMRNLEKLGDKLAGKLEAAVAAGAFLVANAAKEKAPWITGTLRRSIHIGGFTALTPSWNPNHPKNTRTFGDIGKGAKTSTSVELLVGTDLEYAAKIEYGGSRKAPSGYLRPAYDENQEKAQREIGEALKDVLRGSI